MQDLHSDPATAAVYVASRVSKKRRQTAPATDADTVPVYGTQRSAHVATSADGWPPDGPDASPSFCLAFC